MHYSSLHSINQSAAQLPLPPLTCLACVACSVVFLVAFFRKMLLIQFYFNLIATLPAACTAGLPSLPDWLCLPISVDQLDATRHSGLRPKAAD